jgi:hypothetical protein
MQVDDYDEADRHKVNPPIEVESAMWSASGTLDWWVKERGKWLGRVRGQDGRQKCAVKTVVRSGSKLLIFVRRKRADSRGLSLSFVVRRVFTQCRIRLSEWIISLLRFDMQLRAFLSFH